MRCSEYRAQLAGMGRDELHSDAGRALLAHCGRCPECGVFLRQLNALDAELERLPAPAAPAALIERTLAATAARPGPAPAGRRRLQRRWAAGLGSAAALLAAAHLLSIAPSWRVADTDPSLNIADTGDADPEQRERSAQRFGDETRAAAPNAGQSADDSKAAAGADLRQRPIGDTANGLAGRFAPPGPPAEREAASAEAAPGLADRVDGNGEPVPPRGDNGGSGAAAPVEVPGDDALVAALLTAEADARDLDAYGEPSVPQTAPERLSRRRGRSQTPSETALFNREAGDAIAAQAKTAGAAGRQQAGRPERPEPLGGLVRSYHQPAAPAGAAPPEQGYRSERPADAAPLAAADRYLRQRELLQPLRFQPDNGYWANTYLPGDPLLRRLRARLSRWDRSVLRVWGDVDPRLEQTLAATEPLFDAPRGAALGVSLQADKAGLSGPGRVRLQIGIKGAERRGGQRPPMNIAVVLDRRGADSDVTRAVLQALAQAQQPGDRVTLTATGAGLLLSAGQFRYGALQVTLRRLADPAPDPDAEVGAALGEAIANAARSIGDAAGRQADEAPLGSNVILLLTTTPPLEVSEALLRQAHRNALKGISLSAMLVGTRRDAAGLEPLVLAGQGRLRRVGSVDQATVQVRRELLASGRAVARALRLRVQLAPGVRLIEVMGSRRLDETGAQRVREAEQSIDRRLARALGIASDRGEDDDGIQIVIPHFYAGDEHVILFDLLVPRAGPVADLTLRYKDLVYLRNGSVSLHLALPPGERPPGPTQQRVMLNTLAHHTAQRVGQAGELLAAGAAARARQQLRELRTLLQGLQQRVPAWRERLADEQALLDDYLELLTSAAVRDQRLRASLADSLRYAALYRLRGGALPW